MKILAIVLAGILFSFGPVKANSSKLNSTLQKAKILILEKEIENLKNQNQGYISNLYSTKFAGDYALSLGTVDNLKTSPQADEYTIGAWFRVVSDDTKGSIMGKGLGDIGEKEYQINFFNGRLYGIVGGTPSRSVPIKDRNWHFIVIRNQKVGGVFQFSVFLDGKLLDTKESGAYIATVPTFIGARYWKENSSNVAVPGWFFTGSIDEVSFWQKSLLDMEIESLALGGRPKNLLGEFLHYRSSSSLKAWWRMGDHRNDINGNLVVHDIVGDINGTLTKEESDIVIPLTP
ncbi:LamG-like jellyroll fold domain-containing protein [Pseudobacteriovorax antillogorgiicola]|uniref:Concanavalin A-like lectin/glucanases superfamily protein n=1 Tax=Pseudobacteriovorax antillogorgiicola TaxID=1513793 RepID=A0A1Y6C0U9_9BACT|nr:LamG-like jellyroll fold domain-containing protein [Pseudobacteriovorax antillogorgiicola]TCS51123.1 concanavalin A-like lectin/glucanase superfamily protein [Pseudobacteriovorax antillogorgiicola]SMF38549.1 Concanavalin A-like lectin/glucanases superfamily protein [Pseudobacteriovorax antillogorgiicola]